MINIKTDKKKNNILIQKGENQPFIKKSLNLQYHINIIDKWLISSVRVNSVILIESRKMSRVEDKVSVDDFKKSRFSAPSRLS